jgi:hypothetical protein
MAQTTARDIIKAALRKIHVLGRGAPLNANDANEALDELNNMMASFSVEGAVTFQEIKETFSLQNNKEQYTVGSGQDFDTEAFTQITACYVTQGSTDYSVSSFDEKDYARIAQKTVGGSVPNIYYYDDNFPIANVFLYPVPSASTTITFYSRKPLASFANLDGSIDFPPQYRDMLIYNLAIRLASEYEKTPLPQVSELAASTKNAVIGQNRRNEYSISEISGLPAKGTAGYSEENIFGGYNT